MAEKLTMDPITRLNRQSLEAGLMWAVVLHVARQVLLIILNLSEGQPAQQIASGALFFVAFLAYPMLLNAIMQVKTSCWRNPMVHATAGSVLALLGILLISTLGSGMWLEATVSGLGIWLLLGTMLPWAGATKFLTQERGHHKKQWKRLGQLTLIQLVFLQIPLLKK